MPLHEYQCDVCGRRFEKIQKFSDPPVQTCPTCGGAVHKMQSAPAFHLKGTGWYATDYAKKDQSTSAKTDPESKETKKDEAEKAEGKSDGTSGKTGTAQAEKKEKTATDTSSTTDKPPKDKSA